MGLAPDTQLAQRRCDNVVTTSWLTLSKRCGTVENESCRDVANFCSVSSPRPDLAGKNLLCVLFFYNSESSPDTTIVALLFKRYSFSIGPKRETLLTATFYTKETNETLKLKLRKKETENSIYKIKNIYSYHHDMKKAGILRQFKWFRNPSSPFQVAFKVLLVAN